MVADLVLVLVFAGTNNTIARAVSDDVGTGPVRDARLDDGTDGVSDTNIAEEGEVAWAGCRGMAGGRGRGGRCGRSRGGEPSVHVSDGVGEGAAYGRDKVAVGEGGFDDRAADMTCGSEDL